MTDKPRLKFNSKGWFYFWVRFKTGSVLFRSMVVVPDEYGCLDREVWIGPYQTATEAYSAKRDGLAL